MTHVPAAIVQPASPTRRQLLVGLVAAASAPAWAKEIDEPFTGFARTTVRFASLAQSRALLTANDEWMQATGGFQQRSTVGRTDPVTLDEFASINGAAARPWSAAQKVRWTKALHEIAPAFNALRIPLPSEVLLVATSGQDSADNCYTRGNGVMLAGEAREENYSDAMLLAHELWHVASRHAPPLAGRLYALLGLQAIARLQFPKVWQDIRLANPDAPNNAHAMRLNVQGRTPWITPVLVAGRTTLRPGETMFNVMQVRLLEVTPGIDGAPSTAVMRDGQPVWHRLNDPHDYLQQLGGNTDYVIHHEEALADNIAILVNGGKAKNPELLARIKAVLVGAGA
jgi:hypothetical protein